MRLFLDSFWRSVLYCLQPRVLLLSLLPLLLMVAVSAGVTWLFWDAALLRLQSLLIGDSFFSSVVLQASHAVLGSLRTVLAPLLLLTLTLPVVSLFTLWAVAWLVMPVAVRLVARRRFPHLQGLHGGTLLGSMVQAVGSGALALLALVVSIPLWLIPPLVIVIPPLVWGWLAARIMTYDALAQHASEAERRRLMRRHRYPLLLMGVLVGYAGATPGLVWAIGAWAVVMAPLLLPLAVWIYTVLFMFSSLWFSHYLLAALAALRAEPLDAGPSTQIDSIL